MRRENISRVDVMQAKWGWAKWHFFFERIKSVSLSKTVFGLVVSVTYKMVAKSDGSVNEDNGCLKIRTSAVAKHKWFIRSFLRMLQICLTFFCVHRQQFTINLLPKSKWTLTKRLASDVLETIPIGNEQHRIRSVNCLDSFYSILVSTVKLINPIFLVQFGS